MKKELTERQSEIVMAAINLIGEGGIQSLTIKHLSAEIGLTESAIYRHFESRTDILIAVLDYLKDIVISHYQKISSFQGSSLERIKEMIAGQMKIFSDHPPYAIVILSDGLYKNEKILHEKIYTIMGHAKEAFIKIIEEGQKAGEIRNDISEDQIAFVIMGAVRLTVNQWSLSGFSSDLQERGKLLYATLYTLIHKN